MELRIGPPATGRNFYRRPVLIAKLLRALERGNVAFLGPRRTGKTSCLEQIKAEPGPFLPILLDLEKHDTVEAWLAAMLGELRVVLEQPKGNFAHLADKVGLLLAGIRKVELPGAGGVEVAWSQGKAAWRKPADEFLDLLAKSEVPILLQLFLSEIQEGEFKAPPTAKQLERIYLERLVNGSRNQYCDTMFDRLKTVFSETEGRLAREILKAVCRSPDGLGREDFDLLHGRIEPVLSRTASGMEELDHVLDTLKHDGYLLQESAGPRRTRFGSNILRDFWLRKTA